MDVRRRRAGRMFAKGTTQAEVARALGVSRQSVSRWFGEWEAGGADALRGAGRAGRRPLLDEAQLVEVDRVLREGPAAHGFATDLWTLERVAAVIEATTGIAYHPGHVWKLLKRLGWSVQRPARRAAERDDEAVAVWRAERWPKVKKTPGAARLGSSSKTSRASR
jgi:transposase